MARADDHAMSPEEMRRALDYPYEIPDHSYVFDPATGDARPLSDPVPDSVWRDRMPMVSVGSNAAPEQLAHKFPADTDDATPIVAVRTRVRDRDVVYAARVSHYGAVPATLIESPGTEVDLHVTLLTARQRVVMDRSEALGKGYDLEAVPLELVDVGASIPDGLVAYGAGAGPLRVDGSPIALAAITARGRRYPASDEAEVLEHVATRCGLTVSAWLELVTSGPDQLRAMRRRLRDWSHATPPVTEPEDPSHRRPG